MSNYNVDNNINDKNDYLLEGNDEDNSINLFIENKGSLFNENDEEEENLIYKSKDSNINNNITKLVTAGETREIENVEVNNSNNKLSSSQIFIQTQTELFDIPSVNSVNEEKKTLGRKKKNSNSSIQSKRNKFSKDNLIHKFKTIFYQKFLIALVNNLIPICGLGKDLKIRKVESEFIKDLTINLNLDILKKTVAEYFSFEISKKYTKQEKNSNQNIINMLKSLLISKEKFKKLLDTKIEDLYKIFIDDDCVNIIYNEFGIDLSEKKMNSLKYFLDLEEKEEYRKSLEKACKDIYFFFDKKKARKSLNN
jgi:hypothetical protein